MSKIEGKCKSTLYLDKIQAFVRVTVISENYLTVTCSCESLFIDKTRATIFSIVTSILSVLNAIVFVLIAEKVLRAGMTGL